MKNRMKNRLDRIRRGVLLGLLTVEMRNRDSWCGETHIQKAVYLLQEIMQLPTNFKYVLYKHGPFSFELRDELTSLRAVGMLELEQKEEYGPRFRSTEQCKKVEENYQHTLNKYRKEVSFIAESLGDSGVSKLERLSTAVYVRSKLGTDAKLEERAKEITNLKPHIEYESALNEVKSVEKLVKEAEKFFKPE